MSETANKQHIRPADSKMRHGRVTVSPCVAYTRARRVDGGDGVRLCLGKSVCGL